MNRWFKSPDTGLLLLRLAIAGLLFAHGQMKWGLWSMQPSEQLPTGMLYLLRFIGIAEPLAALALTAGYLTRLASFLQSLVMLGAINFKINIMKAAFVAQDTTGWELDLLVLAGLLCLLFTGPGRFSLTERLSARN
ncbi:MAG: DoxX family protein [Calditrichaeota bacterium]|nr:DoxX family protein [Calditrichota bacterium]